MSGFRTPRYNRAGGQTSGRASLSRHMYKEQQVRVSEGSITEYQVNMMVTFVIDD